ncbi:MAG: hypothetical protein Q8P92_04105 [Candidatus Daviesbacteria bacterium]|nr:hypothetical protein [Candidatus Daviesbacteria bacterium]
MKSQRVTIYLPYELAQEFKRIIPKGKRSQFIAEALREKLYK